MLKEYFKIIKRALSQNRKKKQGTYYESHHIVPKSFQKKSKLVLLTPEEHYECHKILAEVFCGHPIYGQKMLWAFHRLAYDKKRKLSKEEFGEARRILMNIWKRSKSEETRKKISLKMKGNTNNGCFKGMKSRITEKGRKKLADLRRTERTDKFGQLSIASKGIVMYENVITGEKIQEGSLLQLSKKTGIPNSTLNWRLHSKNKNNYSDYKVYYL